jgi:hypothetical protein
METISILDCLGNDDKKKSLYMFSTDVHFFLNILWSVGWLNTQCRWMSMSTFDLMMKELNYNYLLVRLCALF